MISKDNKTKDFAIIDLLQNKDDNY